MQSYDEDAFETIAERYSRDLEKTRPEELYKWEATYCFQQNWIPDAQDFAEMLKSSLEKAGNLLAGPNWWPRNFILESAAEYPQEVKEAMLALFDEMVPIEVRIKTYTEAMDKLLVELNRKKESQGLKTEEHHFQDPRSASVLLAFAHPESDYLYKTEILREFAKQIGIVDVPKDKYERPAAFKKLLDGLLEVVEGKYHKLIQRSDDLLAPNLRDADPEHHIFMQDLAWYAASHKETDEPMNLIEDEEPKSEKFTWTDTYMAIADALRGYRDNQEVLRGIVSTAMGKDLNDSDPKGMDPFTFFAVFNGCITNDNKREKCIQNIISVLGIDSDVPKDYLGIPDLPSTNWRFWGNDEPNQIENNWDMFEAAIDYADNSSQSNRDIFISRFNRMRAQHNVANAKLSTGLFWIRPYVYMTSDEKAKGYLSDMFGLDFSGTLSGDKYLDRIAEIRNVTGMTFPQLYFEADRKTKENKTGKSKKKSEPRIWIYSPGDQARLWDQFSESGIMGLGWDELGDFADYDSKKAIADKLRELENTEGRKSNDSSTCWEFQKEMKPGDIVYVRQGKNSIVGRGVVKSDPRYELARKEYKHVRDVEWDNVGKWDSPFGLPTKALTEITEPDKADLMAALFGDTSEENTDNQNYWWLVAKPSIWKFSEIALGEEQDYTLRNEVGNLRRVPRNFQNAKAGDIAVGYEATPKKEIVALCEITGIDAEKMYFKKVKTLEEPISLSDIKETPELSEMEFLKNPNGSFFKLTPDEYACIKQMIPDTSSPIEAKVVEPYCDEDFLAEAYLSVDDLRKMKELLLRKKNLILQGAPGTGKTFVAKRLAYDMMGKQDENHIKVIQFHQNTSYDDFVYGYRPNAEGGFEKDPGVFVRFCRKAADRPDEDFFFIIDEINRSNISKVFGELLMLIEADHRGESVNLLVSGDSFSVPENVYIIGMMNTADRGLALIDYALRRRFAFFEMKPAFDNPVFRKSIAKSGDKLVSLAEAVKKLNDTIEKDPALGKGFRIGHSYFCVDDDAPEDVAESIYEFELAPLIDEYWFDDLDKAKSEKEHLKDALK